MAYRWWTGEYLLPYVDRPLIMKPSPLVGILVSSSFALQLLLASVGSTCVMPMDEPGHTAPSSAGLIVAGMELPGGESPSDMPCDQPSVPLACQIMAPCAGGFAVIASNEKDALTDAPAGAAAAIVSVPVFLAIPPELPPPRA